MLLFIVAWALSACAAPSDPGVPAAATQAARSAPSFSAPWSGPWALTVYAADPLDPGPSALGAALAMPVSPWDGRRLAPPPGTAALVWLPAKAALDGLTADNGRSAGPRGEVVAVLGPGDPAWAQRAAESLPWAGFGVVDPVQSARPWLSDPPADVAGYVAAWVVAEHYKRCSRPCRVPVSASLPPGLDALLGPWDSARLASPDHRTRVEAVRAAVELEGSPLFEDTTAVRLALAARPPDQAALERLATDVDPLVRARAADALSNVRILTTLTSDPSSVVRVIATDRLARIGGADVEEALRRAAASPDGYQRWKAAWGLGKIKGNTSTLVTLLRDPDIDVRREAARSLGRQEDPAAVEPLIVALSDPNSFVRRWAAAGLGELRDGRAEAPLLAAARDPTALVARAAAGALAKLGRNVAAPRFEPPGKPKDDLELAALVRSADATTRKDACKFLAGRSDAGGLLERLASDADSEVRKSAVEAMGWHIDTALGAVALLNDLDPDVRVTALEALRRGGVGNVEAIAALLTDGDAEVRLRSAEALAALGPSRPLLSLLADPDERIRAAVVGVYPDRMEPDDPSILVRRARNGPDPDPMADVGQAAWADGMFAREDDLLHLRFSWNEEQDRPNAHATLRPPVVRAYGHPDRG